jgi:LPS-assembly lipoprotein
MIRFLFLPSVFCLLISGCGFQPVQGKHGIANHYQSISVPTLTASRTEQIFSNALADLLKPRNEGASSRYALEMKLLREEVPIIVSQNRDITRYRVTLTAHYIIKDGEKKLAEDDAKVRVSYNVLMNDFANYSSQVDAEERAAKELAQVVYQHLQRYLVKP